MIEIISEFIFIFFWFIREEQRETYNDLKIYIYCE